VELAGQRACGDAVEVGLEVRAQRGVVGGQCGRRGGRDPAGGLGGGGPGSSVFRGPRDFCGGRHPCCASWTGAPVSCASGEPSTAERIQAVCHVTSSASQNDAGRHSLTRESAQWGWTWEVALTDEAVAAVRD